MSGHSDMSSFKVMISDEKKEIGLIPEANEVLRKNNNKKKKKKERRKKKREEEMDKDKKYIPNGITNILKENDDTSESMEVLKGQKSKQFDVISKNWDDNNSKYKVSNSCVPMSTDATSETDSVVEVMQYKAKKKILRKKYQNNSLIGGAQNGEAFSHDDDAADDRKDIVIIEDDDDDKKVNVSSKDNCESHVTGDSEGASKSKEGIADWFSPLHYVWKGGKVLEALKNQGIRPNRGKWSSEEIRRLDENMKEFLVAHKVNDVVGLVGGFSKEDKVFRKKSRFVFKMCKGIKRTANDVDGRTYRQFSNLRKGVFTDKENQEFLRLHKQYGPLWKRIGYLMNRNFRTAGLTFHSKMKKWNKVCWRPEEDEALAKYVRSFLVSDKTLNDINWRQVSDFVGTRSRRMCHRRWYTKLIYSENNQQVDFPTEDIYKLVSLIYESDIVDEYLIDWDSLATHFNSNIKSTWLKWKFGVISKEVPHSHTLEFEELIQKLYDLFHAKVFSDR